MIDKTISLPAIALSTRLNNRRGHDPRTKANDVEQLDMASKKQQVPAGKELFSESHIINLAQRWRCNLCNIELPNDNLADVRKEIHTKFHIDESIGTTNRRRNWTFGAVKFVLI